MKLVSWNDPVCAQFPCGVLSLLPVPLLSPGDEGEESDCWRKQGMALHIRKLLGTLVGQCWIWVLVQLLLHSTMVITPLYGEETTRA